MQFTQFLITYLIYHPYQLLLRKSSLLLMPKHTYKSDHYSLLPNFKIFNYDSHLLQSTATNPATNNTPNTQYFFKIATHNIQGFNNITKQQL